MLRKIKILKDTVAYGTKVRRGEVIEIPVDEAFSLVHAGRAEFFDETASSDPDETAPHQRDS